MRIVETNDRGEEFALPWDMPEETAKKIAEALNEWRSSSGSTYKVVDTKYKIHLGM